MKIILFFQTPGGSVKYILPQEMSEYSFLPYKKFIVYLRKNYLVLNYIKLVDELDSFQTVCLDGDTGQWHIEVPEMDESNLTFEQMHKLNDKTKKKTTLVERSKKYLDRFWAKRKQGKVITTK